jgi:hypothetical protein
MAKSKARVLADLLGVNNITENDGTLTLSAGAKGDQGTDGSKGQKGETGTTGPAGTGSAGSDGSDGDKGQKGDTGTSGSDGQKGAVGATYYAPDGDKGDKGDTGASGSSGSDGDKGQKGEIGAGGSDGSDGDKGQKGAGGANGTNGTNGSDGDKGQKGEIGAGGSDGSDGDKGDKGDTGAGGSDGSDGDKGDKGDTGAKGTTGNFGGASFKYEFDTATSLGATLNGGEFRLNSATWGSASTMYINTSDVDSNDITDFIESIDDSTSGIRGHVKITLTSDTSEFAMFAIDGSGVESNGVMSIQVSLLSTTRTFSDGDACRLTFARTGDAGDKGVAGSDGAKGDKGDTGAAGSDGSDGSDGSKGQKGDTGAAGSDGSKGQKGEVGVTGSDGSDGSKGQKGEVGVTGSDGSDGSDGSKGQKGEIGAKGDNGQKGEIGAKGTQGDKGAQGDKGTQGDKGDNGQKGEIGTKGVTGDKGTQGDKGDQGTKGEDGTKGEIGAKGAQGDKGDQGTKGEGGTKGDKGEVGAKGVTGDKGAQGIKGEDGTKGDKGEVGAKGDIGVGEKGATGAKGAQGVKGVDGDKGVKGVDGDKGQKGDSNPNADTLDSLDSTQFLRSDAADSFTGTLTWGGADTGVTSLSLNNSNIRAVNLIEINDPGEGIEFKKADHPSSGQNTIVHLRAIDSSPYTIMDFDGATELRVGGTRVLTASDSGGYSLQLNQGDLDEDRYYKIAYILANSGGVYVKGLLGGHETDTTQGSLSLDLAIWSRDGDVNVQGTISGIGGSSDGGRALFVTKDSSNNVNVWVHTDRWALVNLSYSGVSSSTLYHQPDAVTTEPTDDKVFTTITHDVAAESTVVLNGSLTYKDSSNNISTFGSNHSTNSAIRHTTEHGWMQFGPGNSSWAHIETDRPKFYFNKGITVDTGVISSYNEDLVFERVTGNTTPHLVLGNEITTLATPLTMTTKMESSPTSTIFLDVDGDAVNNTNINGGGGSVVFNTSATAGTLSQHNASISGIRSGTGDGSSELQFKTTDSSTSSTPAMRMIINETGRVGIGVGSPSSKLEVSETISADAYHYPLTITARDDGNVVNQTSNNTGVGLRFKLAGNASSTPGDSHIGASIVAVRESDTDDDSSTGLAFNVSQNDATLDEALRIDHDGNVGIGTNNPVQKLQVDGSIYSNGGEFFVNTGKGISAVGDLVFKTNDGNNYQTTMHLDGTDNRVGIGTTDPASKLHVTNGSVGNVSGDEITHAEISGGRHHLDFKEVRTATVSDWPATTYKLQMRVDVTDHQSIDFVSDSNSREHIDIKTGNQVFNTRFTSDGKVGIGTDDPTSPLHVEKAITGDDSQLTITNGAGASIRMGITGSGANENAHIKTHSGEDLEFHIGQASDSALPSVIFKSGGNVGIGTTTPGHKLEVNGSFAATTKSFDIEHPTKDGHRLRYGSLEGPELGVYVRGRSAGGCVELPEHWTGLVDEETITVNLTAIGSAQDLYVEKIENNKVYINCEGECFYTIFGERKDVDKLEVEYEHNIQ